MKHKRATQKLHDAGLTTLVINKGLWGYYITDKTFQRQTGTPCRNSAQEAVDDVLIRGMRPQKLERQP